MLLYMTYQNIKEKSRYKKIQEQLKKEETITITLKEYKELNQTKEQLQKLKSQMSEHCDMLGRVFIQLITDNYHTKHQIKNGGFDY